MCAIFGFLDYGKKISYKMLVKLLKALSIAAESRGTDATGISYVRDKQIVTFKKPVPAHELQLYFPKHTTTLIGHTRFTTQGDEQQNYNNHPFCGHTKTQSFSLAHNGMIHNDKALRCSHSLPDTKIETDSYVAVQLLEQEKEVSLQTVKTMAETIQGSFTFSVLRDDSTLFLVKGSNPLTIWHFSDLGLYLYASTKEILLNAVRTARLQEVFHEVKMPSETILQISPDGSTSSSSFTIAEEYFRGFQYGFYDWLGDEEMEEDFILSDECSGLEDDITLLMYWGYSSREIDELLTDTELFEETVQEIRMMEEML